MKSAKLNPSQIVGGCSTEYPVPRKPMGLLEIILNSLAMAFVSWMLFYPICKLLGVL